MKITGIPNLINIDLLAKSPQAVVDAWKVGQLVNARAVSGPQNGQATININGALLLAQTQFALKPGQPLQLEVSNLSVPTVLKLTGNARPAGATPITITLPAQPQLLGPLQTGQQLSASLLRPVEANPLRTVLELAGNRVNVQLSQPLPAASGQQIKLEVVSPGTIAALKILSTAPGAPADTTTLAQALRNTLPQQAPLAPLLASLALIAKGPASTLPTGNAPPLTQTTTGTPAPTLPQPLVERIRTLVNSLPRSENINSADGLKQAVAQSGLFMEAKLAQSLLQPGISTGAPPVDFKGSLLGLLLTLLNFSKSSPPPTGNTPPQQAPAGAHATLNFSMNLQQALSELLRNVKSGLARVQLNQLVSSATEDDGRRSWLIELPLRSNEHIDLLQLRIAREKDQGKSAKAVMWTVTLELELSGLGPVQARVTLRDKIVNTTFWAEHAPSSELIKQHLKILQTRYQEVGLTVGNLSAHHGTAPEAASADAQLPHILLDEKV